MSSLPSVGFMVLPHGEGLPIPSYKTVGAAGLDLPAALEKSLVLQPQERIAVPTGFRIRIPQGFEGQIRPRSGMSLHHGITVPNAPGTIDSDYRGELKVILLNSSSVGFTIERGMRIAQLVIAPVVQANIQLLSSFDITERGESGFGSTGVN